MLIGSFSHDSVSFEYIGQSPQYLQGLLPPPPPHTTPVPAASFPSTVRDQGENLCVVLMSSTQSTSCDERPRHRGSGAGRPWPREVRKSHGLLGPHHIEIWGASLARGPTAACVIASVHLHSPNKVLPTILGIIGWNRDQVHTEVRIPVWRDSARAGW